MKIIGIIAEYNPFHNGHIYHIKKIKELFPDSLIILVLSGYFNQRGDISIISKEDKTKIALDNNIDIILELPVIFGTQSSDVFAKQSIKILNEYGIEYLVFGSESNDIDLINKIVDIELYDEDYDNRVKEYLDEGLNYPTALSKALNININLDTPNDLLAISYIKTIKQMNYNIKPIMIKRTNDYHDLTSNNIIISASNIRQKFINEESISYYLPKEEIPLLHKISNNDLFTLLKFKILTDDNIDKYLDVNEGIDYRILKNIKDSKFLDQLISDIKTKRYTYNKINRMLLHILLGLKKEDANIHLDYIKILGFNKKGQEYLKTIKDNISLPTKPPKDSKIYKYELTAAYLYEQAINKSLNDFDKNNIPIIKE